MPSAEGYNTTTRKGRPVDVPVVAGKKTTLTVTGHPVHVIRNGHGGTVERVAAGGNLVVDGHVTVEGENPAADSAVAVAYSNLP